MCFIGILEFLSTGAAQGSNLAAVAISTEKASTHEQQ
jgi:hypothetical protein